MDNVDIEVGLDGLILSLVEDGPIKGIDLALKVATAHHGVQADEIEETISRLITNHQILEIEYILPSMDYRVKTMLFPKGTTVTVKG